MRKWGCHFSLDDHLQRDPDLLIECLKTPGVFTQINKRHDFTGDLYRLFNRPESVQEICLGSLQMERRRRDGPDRLFWSEKKMRKHGDFQLSLCVNRSEIHHSLTFWQAVVEIEPLLISYGLSKNREWQNDESIMQQLKNAAALRSALATLLDLRLQFNLPNVLVDRFQMLHFDQQLK